MFFKNKLIKKRVNFVKKRIIGMFLFFFLCVCVFVCFDIVMCFFINVFLFIWIYIYIIKYLGGFVKI